MFLSCYRREGQTAKAAAIESRVSAETAKVAELCSPLGSCLGVENLVSAIPPLQEARPNWLYQNASVRSHQEEAHSRQCLHGYTCQSRRNGVVIASS